MQELASGSSAIPASLLKSEIHNPRHTFTIARFPSVVAPSLCPSSIIVISTKNTLTMADKAVQSATTAMAEVRLDENGQPLSKNALKKLLKAEAAAKKKAEKAAAKVR